MYNGDTYSTSQTQDTGNGDSKNEDSNNGLKIFYIIFIILFILIIILILVWYYFYKKKQLNYQKLKTNEQMLFNNNNNNTRDINNNTESNVNYILMHDINAEGRIRQSTAYEKEGLPATGHYILSVVFVCWI